MRRLSELPLKWLVAIAFVVGNFMEILDATAVNVSVPTLTRQFHSTTSTVEWVVTGYTLAYAVVIPAAGWLGDRFGTKRVFSTALLLFTAASAMCAASNSIHMLIIFRLLQGASAGCVTPVSSAMLYRAFPPQERAAAAGIFMGPAILAPALGPVLGGWLTTDFSWRWIFLINVPIGLLGFLFVRRFLVEHREPKAGRLDVPGFVLAGGGLGLLLFAITQGPGHGWRSGLVLGSGIGGALLLASLVVVELRISEPMLDLRLLGNRMFRNAAVVSFTTSGALFGLLFVLPLYLQDLRGLNPLKSGLTTFPQALGFMLMIRPVSKWYHRFGPRRMMIGGLVSQSMIALLFLSTSLTSSFWWIRLFMLMRGLSMSFVFIPMQAASFATIRPPDMGRASSLSNVMRQVGAATGTAVLATIFISRTRANVGAVKTKTVNAIAHARLDAFHTTFISVAALVLLGILAASLIRDEDAQATMVARAQPQPVH